MLASITLMSRVWGRMARRMSVGSISPFGCGATNVVSTPRSAMRCAACITAECSMEVVMKWSPG